MEFIHVIKKHFGTEVSNHTHPRTGQQYFNIILTTVATTRTDKSTHPILHVRNRQQNRRLYCTCRQLCHWNTLLTSCNKLLYGIWISQESRQISFSLYLVVPGLNLCPLNRIFSIKLFFVFLAYSLSKCILQIKLRQYPFTSFPIHYSLNSI
jgi:hypothetical protein